MKDQLCQEWSRERGVFLCRTGYFTVTQALFLSAVCLPPLTTIPESQHGTALLQTPFSFKVSSVEGELMEVSTHLLYNALWMASVNHQRGPHQAQVGAITRYRNVPWTPDSSGQVFQVWPWSAAVPRGLVITAKAFVFFFSSLFSHHPLLGACKVLPVHLANREVISWKNLKIISSYIPKKNFRDFQLNKEL